MRVFALLAVSWTGLVWSSGASAQQFEKVCLPQQDAGDGASVAVDARNRIHFSRISRLSGALQHSVMHPDGRVVDAQIVLGVSLLAFNEVDSTQIVVDGERPAICYHHAVNNTFEVAVQTDDGWQREVVQRGVGLGRWCSMIRHRRTLAVAFGSDDGRLRYGLRLGADDWQTEIIDEPDDDAGIKVSLTEVGGALVAAHQTTGRQLRVTWQLADGWQSQPMMGLAAEAGVAPVAVAGDDGEVWVVHGTAGPPGTSDAGLILTQGRLGMFRHGLIADDEAGGSNGAVRIDGGLVATTRVFRRNAVFGDADALRYYSNAEPGSIPRVLESAGPGQQRHRYSFVGMTADRFDLPVIVALDETGSFQGERGTTFTCAWRPIDSDADAIPDEAEERYGTDPDNPDTDGDGRLDGTEVLVHGTDPLIVDPVPPDMGPAPDLGIADFGIADFGIVDFDAGGPDMDAPDAGGVDAMLQADVGGPDDADRGVAVDAGDVDGAVDADAAVTDLGAAADQAVRDQAVADQGDPAPEPMVDAEVADDAEPVGFEPIEPPRIDAGEPSGADRGGDGGCAQAASRDGAPGLLLGLLGLGWARRRRRG